jgi:nitrite reductase/ring-hydroxylating ferredoxin subunit
MHLQSAPGTELTTCPLALLRPDVVVECGAVAIVSSGGRLHAFEAQCPHGAASLGEGSVRRGVLT